jgi:hypothetical protein
MLIRQILTNCALHSHDIHSFEDERGALAALEGGRSVPFDIARVYYLYGVGAGAERGFHAHRLLHQWAVCVNGSCTMVVDDGRRREAVTLDSPALGLHLGPMIWREMRDFTPGSVLLVLASAHHDEADYIRDYAQFIRAAQA